jgi:hypothetical protein
MIVTLSGASDDLIELDGDIYEEFTYQDRDGGEVVAFSDGTVLRIMFSESGVWRISPVFKGTAGLSIDQVSEDEQTDTATLTGAIAWAVHGINWVAAKS